MRSLVIGRGFGSLYEHQLTFLHSDVTTVDANPNKTATYLALTDIPKTERYDVAHVCTPNFLHEPHARLASNHSSIVFVEKPGLCNADRWLTMVSDKRDTRFFLVKNNMFRSQVSILQEAAKKAKTINLLWMNYNRVPSPGSWFTTKNLAFGGVSRDLMPHLLSWIPALFPENWRSAHLVTHKAEQRWKLDDQTDTSYGKILKDGVYDVDDYAQLQFVMNGRFLNLETSWRTMSEDKLQAEFIFDDGSTLIYKFGLCPEYAYRDMIKTCVDKLDDAAFWVENQHIDTWIHTMLEKLDE